MKCPRCDTKASDSALFCAHCGAELSTGGGRACTSCGSALPVDANFCPACGASISSSTDRHAAIERLIPKQYLERLNATRGRPSGERRVVTIVFFDVKGSTAMAEDLDPEDVMDVMNGAFEVLIAPIYRYEGTLARLMGDAVLAFFGAPVAHEDDAARACRAALDVLERAREYGRRLERERGIAGFDVRVGVNTGLVAVGEVGNDLRVEYTAMGDAVNVAARLEAAAEPGTILIARETQRLVAEVFETEDLGEIRVKGKREPVEVHRLLRPRSPVVGPGASTTTGPMVGREREVEALSAALGAAERGSAVAVVGPAGVGKSRLIAEVRSLQRDLQWCEVRCASYARDIGYWVAREMLHALIGVGWGHAPGEVAAALVLEVNRVMEGGDDAYRYLAHLLGLPLDDDARDAIAHCEAAELREHIRDALSSYVAARARRSPFVLFFDDFQWVDERSREIVDSLRMRCGDSPLHVVVALRSEHDEGLHESWGTTIELAPLDADASAALARQILAGSAVPPALVQEVIDGAQGNPFFLEEVLKSLMDVVDMVDSGWNMRSLAVPTTLHGAVMHRVDSLEPREKDALRAAAVIGREFSRDVLADVCGHSLDECLDELLRREFLQRLSDPESVYSFRQAMTAEVAYDSLLKAQRADLHRRAGEAIERLFPGRRIELSPVLAHHFECAGEGEKAFEYLIHAARRASDVSANRESIRRYRRALNALTEGAEPPGTVVRDVAAVHEELADVYAVVANYAAAVDHYDTAAGLVADARRLVVLRRKKGEALQRWGKHEEAGRLFEALLEDEGKPLDTTEAAHIYSALGMARYHAGRLDAALELVSRALDTLTELDNKRGVARATNNLGVIHAKLGSYDDALTYHHRALAVWEHLGDDYGLAAAHNNLGLAHRGCSQHDEAVRSLLRAIELFEKIGNRHGLACAYDNLAQVHMDLEQTGVAHEYMKKAVAIMAEISMDKSEMLPEMWQSGPM